jgi:hypothetical protein
MTAAQLNRKLLFSGYGEVTDFLRNSPLNRFLYKKVLGVLSASGIAVPVVTLFNEIYYQCVRVNYDGTPGVDFERRYWSEEEAWIGSADGTQLVFCVVWALLGSKRDFTFQEECFQSALAPYIRNSALREFADELPREIRSCGFSLPDRFPVMTCPVSELPIFKDKGGAPNRFWGLDDPAYITLTAKQSEVHDAWEVVTCGFTHSVIEQYVRLYANQDDQLRLLACMESALTQNEAKEHGAFFKDLALRITTGSFDPTEGLSLQPVSTTGTDAGVREQLFSLDMDDGGDGSLDLARQYRQERDVLKEQLEEMRKSHAMELAHLEARYRAEIKELLEENSRFIRWSRKKSGAWKPAGATSGGLVLHLDDVADYVKKRFSRSGGEEVSTMLYHLAVSSGTLAEETFAQIDSIIPAIMERDHPHQTLNMSHVEQFNNNLGKVVGN